MEDIDEEEEKQEEKEEIGNNNDSDETQYDDIDFDDGENNKMQLNQKLHVIRTKLLQNSLKIKEKCFKKFCLHVSETKHI